MASLAIVKLSNEGNDNLKYAQVAMDYAAVRDIYNALYIAKKNGKSDDVKDGRFDEVYRKMGVIFDMMKFGMITSDTAVKFTK